MFLRGVLKWNVCTLAISIYIGNDLVRFDVILYRYLVFRVV
jgi:hypothetical protein